MPVEVAPNPYHPTRDVAVLRDPWAPRELRAAAAANPRPLSAKAVQGTRRHAALLEAGASVYQSCPPLALDTATPAVAAWARCHRLLPVGDARGLDVRELWTRWYEVVHRGWSPTAPREALRELFTGLTAEIDPARTRVCVVEGIVVAAAFVFPGDDPEEILTEALEPDHPRAREAVASCLAAALAEAAGEIRCDGHVSDPHFFPLWSTVPGVHAGPDDPLDLLEIRG